MKKHIKLFLRILCALLCLIVLLSTGSIIHSYNHNCIGEDCHICQAIAFCKDGLNLMTLFCFGNVLAVRFIQLLIIMKSLFGIANNKSNLVACKVKLTS